MPRLIVGLVFLPEAIQKFLFPELVGAGRFGKTGFTNPEFLPSVKKNITGITGNSINTVRKIKQVKEN